MADELPLRHGIAIPRSELSWRFSRSSGPGGQSVNTADSRVELRWNLASSDVLPPVLKARALERLAGRLVDGAVVVTAQEHREQLRNRRAAELRLVTLVAAAIAPNPPARRPTKPSRGVVQRRLDSKRKRSITKRLRGRPDD